MAAFQGSRQGVNFSKPEDLVGIPYVEYGQDCRIGLDCWSLVALVYGWYGVVMPPRPSAAVPISYCDSGLAEHGWHSVNKAERMDMVCFRSVSGQAQHVGIYLGYERVLHTTSKTGVCILPLNVPWRRHITGVYRHETVWLAEAQRRVSAHNSQ